MTLPDYRIQLPPTRIDFNDNVGNDGLAIDNYPAPSSQPRYDWLRSIILGLLSNQASHNQPTQYKLGTLWFDLNTNILKIWNGTIWADLSNSLQLDTDQNNNPITLQEFYNNVKILLGYTPTATFSGHSTNNGVSIIQIPTALRIAANPQSRPFVWINGVLADPRKCAFAGGTTPISVQLSGGLTINNGQTFTVLIIAIDQTFFSVGEVIL